MSKSLLQNQVPFSSVYGNSSLNGLFTLVCRVAAGASPLCHFGPPSLWRESEYESWGCWSFSCLWRPYAGPADRTSKLFLLYFIHERQRLQQISQRAAVDGPQYLSWVGIGCSLVGQGQRVRLGHGVITVSTQ